MVKTTRVAAALRGRSLPPAAPRISYFDRGHLMAWPPSKRCTDSTRHLRDPSHPPLSLMDLSTPRLSQSLRCPSVTSASCRAELMFHSHTAQIAICIKFRQLFSPAHGRLTSGILVEKDKLPHTRPMQTLHIHWGQRRRPRPRERPPPSSYHHNKFFNLPTCGYFTST